MIELIPLKKHSLLISRKAKLNILMLITHVIDDAILAYYHYLSRNYAAFDAQVGETSCQIRAYKICQLAEDDTFTQKVHQSKRHLQAYQDNLNQFLTVYNEKIISSKQYSHELDQNITLEQFLECSELELDLSKDLKFIILSFFLKKYCLVDDEQIPNAINYAYIKQQYNIGLTASRNLAEHYQSLLSKLSCEYVCNLLLNYHVKDGSDHLLKKFLKTGDRDRCQLPYYNTMKILLTSLSTAHLPILFSIKSIHDNKHYFMLCKKMNNTWKYNWNTQELFEEKGHCIVFRGSSAYAKNLSISDDTYLHHLAAYSCESIILLNAATHPQYAGEHLANLRIDPYVELCEKNDAIFTQIHSMKYELVKQQSQSLALGFAKENQNLFYIKHIFCDLISNEINAQLFAKAIDQIQRA